MKGISVFLVAVVAVAFTATVAPAPSYATEYGEIAPTRKSPWPKWFYYDQLGLREWHKGNKERALNYFDQSYKLCKNEVGMTPHPLDTRTKQMVSDVVNHRQFHLTAWQSAPLGVGTSDLRDMINRPAGNSIASDDRKMVFIEDLEKFAKHTLGEHHLTVQALGRYRNLDLSDAQKKLYLDKMTKGKPTLGTSFTPKWYTNDEGKTLTQRLGPKSKKATEDRFQDGVSYSGGKKITQNKRMLDANGWVIQPKVGVANNADPKAPPVGWGLDPKNPLGTNGAALDVNKWGVKPDDVMKTPDTKRNPWGLAGTEQGVAPITNKPWGNSGADETSKDANGIPVK